MPFTFSHPALVLPLLKRKKLFSATGLIIGSIIPDFESFIFLREYKIYGHYWKGVFWFDLPLAIIVSFIFHGIVRNPLIKNLPGFLGNKFIRAIGFNWVAFFRKHALMVIISMLIGIVSHLLWDALTHLNLKYPDARDSDIYIHDTLLFMVLQYVSSVLGLIIVLWYIMALPTLQVKKQRHSKNTFYIGTKEPLEYKAIYWGIYTAVAGGTIVLILKLMKSHIGSILYIEIFISGLLLALVLTPLLQKILRLAKWVPD